MSNLQDYNLAYLKATERLDDKQAPNWAWPIVWIENHVSKESMNSCDIIPK